MYLIIVGAGAVSKQLIAIAKEQGHKVAVIEKKTDRAREIMQEFDVRVFNADIAQGKVLEEAEVKRADAIIAATKDDSVNLMTMVLGKHYQVENLITLLQETEHRVMFEELGVTVLSDPEKLIAEKLYSFIDSKE
ncbi:MAG: NAD-binding protein [Pleurocapsa sp. MO_226.B13]|nr:NAD-binding protein [Pleurocapsa sp. MO_226.B13]